MSEASEHFFKPSSLIDTTSKKKKKKKKKMEMEWKQFSGNVKIFKD